MNLRKVAIGCALALSLTPSAFGLMATRSDVADAAMNRNIGVVRSLLQQKADVNAPQADGSTALHWAAYWNDIESADLLIAAGANARTATREGATPMALASLNGSAAMIEKLLRAGADVNAPVMANGETALMLA